MIHLKTGFYLWLAMVIESLYLFGIETNLHRDNPEVGLIK